jgi:hypothetical protein
MNDLKELRKMTLAEQHAYSKGWHDCYSEFVTIPKKLTDEEIQELAFSEEFWINEDFPIFDWLKFARAVLRKTQEADKIESLGTVNIGGVHYRNGKAVK